MLNAPLDEAPLPLMVRASNVPNVNPFKSNVAPDETIVPEAVVPSGVLVGPPAIPNFNVPALTVVNPLNVLKPETVHAPVPDFVSEPDVVPIILAKEHAVAVPPSVSPNVAPTIVPVFVRMMLPVEGAAIKLELPSDINPL